MKSFLDDFLEGDPRILHEIYHSKTSDQIRRDVRRKGGNDEEAEDVLVFAILRVRELMKQGKYQDQQKFYGFLRTVSSYIYKEHRAQKSREPFHENEIPMDEEITTILEAMGRMNSLEVEKVSVELKLRLEKAIKHLKKREQELIQLRYFKGLSLIEIGKQLGIRQPNVVHHRILKKLKKLIS